MGPSARLRAVEELISPLAEGPDFLPIDQALNNYSRTRRYIGSKDRRAIRETTYMILRCWQALKTALSAAKAPVSGRSLVLSFLKFNGMLEDGLFGDEKYGLPALTKEEEEWLARLDNVAALPAWAALNCPEWLYPAFEDRFGADATPQLMALNERAPVGLRLNTLKAKTAPSDLPISPSKLVKNAYILDEEKYINHSDYYKNGILEIQDAGSQVAAALVDAKPGQQVLDLCAGAGGKTLALAADMQNTGRIFAYDIEDKRLKTLKTRALRAGARNIQVAGREDLAGLKGKMDRVLLDVPCSGTGTWRRQPDARLRLTPEKLETYKNQQKTLLSEGAEMVKPGGWLIYVTCSLLKGENEDQISAFLGARGDFQPLDYREIEGFGALQSLSNLGWALQLSPASHGTDGFFVAVMEKAGV